MQSNTLTLLNASSSSVLVAATELREDILIHSLGVHLHVMALLEW